MPSATITKPVKAGIKRKSAPTKSVYVKESKKAKIDAGKVPKSALKPTKKPVQSSDSESEDSEDGGAPLAEEDSDSRSLEEGDLPKVTDGLHPERAKAVVVNSKLSLVNCLDIHANSTKANHLKKHMRSKSNLHRNEKLQNL